MSLHVGFEAEGTTANWTRVRFHSGVSQLMSFEMMFFHEVHTTVLADEGSNVGMFEHVVSKLRRVVKTPIALLANEVVLLLML